MRVIGAVVENRWIGRHNVVLVLVVDGCGGCGGVEGMNIYNMASIVSFIEAISPFHLSSCISLMQ